MAVFLTTRRMFGAIASLGLVLAASPAFADEDEAISPSAQPEPSHYHGRVYMLIQSLHTGSLITDSGDIPGRTETDTQGIRIGVDYMLTPKWELHASVPYIRKRSNGGPGAHRLDILDEPHPEADFLDDTLYHSNWQDWELGVSYHGTWRSFMVQPSITLQTPASDYSFFANAATGQHVNRVLLGIDITRQALGSNFYWSAGYTYVMQEEVMGIHANKNRFRLEAGYFFSPEWSMRVFTNSSIGQGYGSSHFTERHSEDWYHHDQTSKHNFAIAGIGASYSPNRHYTFSLSCAGMYWGRTVHDLKHAYELSIARSF